MQFVSRGNRVQSEAVRFTPRLRGGVTIVELLVVILIVAVILSLALPSLAKARKTGRKLRDVLDARTVAVALSRYTAEYKDSYPYDAYSREPWRGVRLLANTAYPNAYFRASRLYIYMLQDPELLRPPFARELYADASNANPIYEALLWMPGVFFAQPAYWSDVNEPPFDANNFSAVSASQVSFPDRKCLVRSRETDAWYPLGDHVIGALADGSANDYLVPPPTVNLSREFGSDARTWMTTLNGVRGVDVISD